MVVSSTATQWCGPGKGRIRPMRGVEIAAASATVSCATFWFRQTGMSLCLLNSGCRVEETHCNQLQSNEGKGTNPYPEKTSGGTPVFIRSSGRYFGAAGAMGTRNHRIGLQAV